MPLARGPWIGTLPAMTVVEVITVDAEESFRHAARAAVNATPGFAHAAEAASAEEAIEAAVALCPALAIVAEDLPGIDGLKTSRRLRAAVPDTVVVLVHDGNPPDAEAVKSSDAAALLSKEALAPAALRALWA